ncbi:UDP-N-acetylmuramate:L-alanyl-gamma-D-glutamyl-meso-diaminopimelate ligase [Shewanella surugensis]|uniref:UDP-N-acetylmuramate--L-alanyl-gamma-D-glutamyl-meso-2,6-diaminoheptandioate ligase n=1 Tax=Shewanella surugensis TaxID=212020 RepID=A0ABT0LIN9_9GAMM|nr:UDP-N-acetylmuramate:L-alanyl-gamma-D-glutamyl-meso-diaminopimelate ligase [Shewanella surugensis]MCL1127573.1 UDP-N-acetylmuramate:L-alanyl-gamma-D-glutamyl-meso-diaminopimelate ligase [Shewanella surugensis]
MHLHILGICGTFMGGLALLARSKGHKVTGCDLNVYPPMSTQLQEQGIGLIQGYDPQQLGQNEDEYPDLVVIGNAMSRGNLCVEAVLNKGISYTSGPQFLAEHILNDKWVLAVSGTHGKTSTASMLAWILDDCGYTPGFLIGGVPQNLGVSARLGDSPFFVVEADEYDSAFFDKRSKFVHYRPRTLVVNNLEFDHADIFDDLSAIQKQFHHLIRTVPGQGKIIWPVNCAAIAEVMDMGCWSEQETLDPAMSNTQSSEPINALLNDQINDIQADWYGQALSDDAHEFDVFLKGKKQGTVRWDLIGQHNIDNGLMAIAAARHVGVTPEAAITALGQFMPPKRRMELLETVKGVAIYDDFAHHPTAIATSVAGMRAKIGLGRMTLIIEPRSNTMKAGVHKETLADSFMGSDEVYLYQADKLDWDMQEDVSQASMPVKVLSELDDIIAQVIAKAKSGDTIIIMSNGGFGGLHQTLIKALKLTEALIDTHVKSAKDKGVEGKAAKSNANTGNNDKGDSLKLA